ncbi:HAD-IIB family hydrolase [Amaricoccus macauensis]|uniref:HAD-IIB family hydrolase n=1 Tax=Amaricoccus macauensis TaxID=57001 RepID=UPI003C7B26C2
MNANSTRTFPIVFSDLDGTLLDHATYDYAPAKPALARLKELSCPLVLASSKTAPEMAAIRSEIGFEHCPAIVENGAGVMAPGPFDPHADANSYDELRMALDSIPAQLREGFTGFGDWSAEQVAEQTGLSVEKARLAKARHYSEPGLWHGTEADERSFLGELAEMGISARRGGRFLTLSFGASKADRMEQIAERLAGEEVDRVVTLALGDAPNDLEMLEHADRGVIVANPSGTGIPHLAGEDAGRITRTALHGPAGWNEAVFRFLAEIGA